MLLMTAGNYISRAGYSSLFEPLSAPFSSPNPILPPYILISSRLYRHLCGGYLKRRRDFDVVNIDTEQRRENALRTFTPH